MNTDLTIEPSLLLMPWPDQIVLPTDSEAGTRLPSAATTIEWLGHPSPQAEEYTERALSLFSLGQIQISISDATEDLLPHLSMDESYILEVMESGVSLSASSVWGVLRGVASLIQLATKNQLSPGLTLTDRPRFPWRGLLLDVARHYFPIGSLISVVDGLAAVKMNVLHLHLSDDQGFRFPSAAFPRLASEEHYTADQLRGLVAYAAERGVRVVPELDMPGHVTSWLVAYPKWGSRQTSESRRFGVHQACLNPLDDEVYQSIETLLGEVVDIFPDEYLHVGGDEVNPSWWQSDPTIAAYLEEQQMSAQDLQNEFLTRICAIVERLGKRAVGWDEVLHPGMPKCVVQNWRGATTRDRALQLSRSVIVSAPYYLDLHYPADIHYGFDPEASQADWLEREDALQSDPRLLHIADGIEWTKQWRNNSIEFEGDVRALGGEACLWSELVNPDVLSTRLWSRLPVVAERLWSPSSCRDIGSMYLRLQACWQCLPENPEETAREKLSTIGLNGPELNVVSLLEPVKWYGRLLGKRALEARLAGTEMPKARPYQVDTPLNRIVDFLPPESLAARRLNAVSPFTAARQVKDLLHALEEMQPNPLLLELESVLSALDSGADLLLALQAGDCSANAAFEQMQRLAQPQDEYVAAPLIYWCRFLSNGSLAG